MSPASQSSESQKAIPERSSPRLGVFPSLKLVSATQYFHLDKIRVVPADGGGGDGGGGGGSTNDDCPDGLAFCVTFDQASTTYPAPNRMNAEGIEWWASNKNNSVTETDPDLRSVWLQNQYVHHGTHAMQMMAREDDNCVPTCSSTNERSEINLNAGGPPPTGAVHRVTQWWAHSVYFPPQFLLRADDGGSGEKTAIFFQFHHGGRSPAIAFEVFGQLGTERRKVFRMWSWGPKSGGSPGESDFQYRYTAPGESGSRPGACFERDVEEGVWYDFIHKIVWANNGTGEHHVWMRKAGSQTVTKVLGKTGLSLGLSGELAAHWQR